MDKLPNNLFSQSEQLSADKVYKLIKKVQQYDDRAAKQKLVKAHLKLVVKIAHRFKTNDYSLGDIFQVGIIGLLKAINKFELSREVKFSTYAVPVVIGEIKMFLRADSPVKVGRSLKQKAQEIKQEKQILAQELKREPTIKELANRLDFPREEIVAALDAVQQPTSLDKNVNQEENLSLIDQLADLEEYSYTLKKLALNEGLKELDLRARKLIKLRFLQEMSQQEVADRLNISQAHVSRLEKKVVTLLRKRLN